MTSIGSLRSDVNEVAQEIDDGYSDNPSTYNNPKVIRDAIWDFHKVKPAYLTLLDSPFLQRLRFLSQTAFTISTYPCAQHSRFEHTLGVLNATEKMLSSLEDSGTEIEEPRRTETKLAALLHDIGHGPFSHASETVYGRNDVFQDLDEKFGNAFPSEILSYCLIESDPFRELLRIFQAEIEKDIGEISVDNITNMILGNQDDLPDGYHFLRYIINGPFDADKFDYINRDGYFTGLEVTLDVERLLQGLRVSEKHDIMVITSKALSALEQVYIGKSQLYSQVYHHQKIRAAASIINKIFEGLEITSEEVEPGYDITNPASYLLLDENDILSGGWDNDEANRYIEKLRRRELPKRALVISHSCLPDTREELPKEMREISDNWRSLRGELKNNFDYRERQEKRIGEISTAAGGESIIDIPAKSPVGDSTDPPLIRMGSEDGPLLEINDVFPAESWANAHDFYRQRSYIFTDAGQEDISKITDGALEWLNDNGVRVSPLAVRDAKIDPGDLDWDEDAFLGS